MSSARRTVPVDLAVVLAGLVLALVGSPALAEDTESPPPNVVLILVDDLGWMDLSCQGSDYYRTPSVDRLAKEGLRFTQGYAACAVCSPTRAAVQTGRYPARVGVTDWIRARFQRGGIGTPDANPTEYVGSPRRRLLCPPNPYWMERSEVTIAELLRAEGYATAYIGKWHLGDDDWYPTAQGYDVNRGGCDYGQPPSYFDPYSQPNSRHASLAAGIPHLPPREEGEYLTHREADEAVALIRKWKDRPFFIQVAHYAVHTPIQAIDAVAAEYRREGKQEIHAKYAAMVESVDDSTREILAVLEELELDERTLVIFTSDNGGLDNGGRPTDNAPLRSGKGFPYEGGIRVPFLVRWPGVVPPGSVSDEPVGSIDILPTLLEAAGASRPEDVTLDGLSLVEHLRSGGKSELGRDALYWHFPHYRGDLEPYSIVREGDWKLIRFLDAGRDELYDLAADPGEGDDVSARHPERVRALAERLDRALDDMGALRPRPNPAYVAEE